jgi:hypothetical protein
VTTKLSYFGKKFTKLIAQTKDSTSHSCCLLGECRVGYPDMLLLGDLIAGPR